MSKLIINVEERLNRELADVWQFQSELSSVVQDLKEKLDKVEKHLKNG